MKDKNPVLAAILNVIFPGLGCAYVGNWFYAVVFFIWVPLAYAAAIFVVGVVASLISDVTIRNVFSVLAGLLLILRILYEQVSMPYRMAVEFNQEMKVANE